MNLPTEIVGRVVVVHTPEELGEDQAERFVRYVTGRLHRCRYPRTETGAEAQEEQEGEW